MLVGGIGLKKEWQIAVEGWRMMPSNRQIAMVGRGRENEHLAMDCGVCTYARVICQIMGPAVEYGHRTAWFACPCAAERT